MLPMLHMKLGEVSPGGVGVGLMGILVYALLAVFIAGLMVGRTPEYLGKKIQAAEMKLVVLYLIAMPLASLALRRGVGGADVGGVDDLQPRSARPVGGALQLRLDGQQQRLGVRRAGHRHRLVHGDAWASSMLMGRFFLIIPALAIGGSLVRKQKVPATAGTFPTDSPLFGGLVVGAIVIIAGLTFFPALGARPDRRAPGCVDSAWPIA